MIIKILKIFIEISELMNKYINYKNIYKKFELINKHMQNFVLIKNKKFYFYKIFFMIIDFF